MAAIDASVLREGDALVFTGAIDREATAALWASASKALAGTQRFVLTKVTTVDSAGLALLAELSARLRQAGTTPVMEGEPAGLSELRAAYRLTPGLDFPGSHS
ncbi:MAG: STAS domain-containing protein [Pseudoxanthomonas sp.]